MNMIIWLGYDYDYVSWLWLRLCNAIMIRKRIKKDDKVKWKMVLGSLILRALQVSLMYIVTVWLFKDTGTAIVTYIVIARLLNDKGTANITNVVTAQLFNDKGTTSVTYVVTPDCYILGRHPFWCTSQATKLKYICW